MQTIAIIGLGRVGGFFLEQMLLLKERDVHLAAVVEPRKTSARDFAEENGVEVLDLDELVALGEGVDIIFELTGDSGIRRELHSKLQASGNTHTVFLPESVARLMSKFVSEHPLPEVDRPPAD